MDPDPDQTPDPTPFFRDFKDAKKLIFFLHIFSYNLPAGTLSSIFLCIFAGL
jgi:hypothetical protein